METSVVVVTVKHRLQVCLYGCGCIHWGCWGRWRGWCKPAVAASYVVILLVLLPLLVFHLQQSQADQEKVAVWFIAGLFVLLTLPIFLAGLVQHVLNYTQPHLQKHIIRILWIVPIYSLNSWLALTFSTTAAIYLDTLRECYEAYVLYNFLCYLCNYLTSEYRLVAELEARPTVSHHVPCCCLPPWPKGAEFVRRCRIGVLQYVVVRLVLTVISLITQLCHIYYKGVFKVHNAWVYLSLLNGISQAIALHSLFYFYKGTRELLKPIHPIGKFFSIKAIIFAMFWQSVLISILVRTHAIPVSWGEYDLQEGLQNFVVVLEMLLFAIAHYFVFSHKPFVDPAAAEVPCITTCFRMLDIRDMADDVKEHFVDPIPRPKFRTSTARGSSSTSGSAEKSPLLKFDSNTGTSSSRRERGSSVSDSEGTADRHQGRRGRDELTAERSFDVLSYGDLDSRANTYGLRARMIANACVQIEEEHKERTVSGTSSSSTTSSDEGESASRDAAYSNATNSSSISSTTATSSTLIITKTGGDSSELYLLPSSPPPRELMEVIKS